MQLAKQYSNQKGSIQQSPCKKDHDPGAKQPTHYLGLREKAPKHTWVKAESAKAGWKYKSKPVSGLAT